MRSTGVLLSALALVVTAGCTSSLPDESPEETASSQVATQAPTEEETPAADDDDQQPSASATDRDERGQDSEITASETHGKLLLTSDGAVRDAEDLHGKIVVGQGGCIAFVPIPDGGRPLALVAPEGSEYDGENHVTIGDETYRFGELVDLQGVAEENADYPEAERCGDQLVRIAD